MSKEKKIIYLPQGNELEIAVACFNLQFPLMLRGPTGSGKTTLAYHLANLLGKKVVPQNFNEDTLASDLIGRNMPSGWIDGSMTRSLRIPEGAIFYADEIGEARSDTMVVIHSVTDDRREFEVTGRDEVLKAKKEWMLVASYNPAYQVQGKVKPSTAQRFITIDLPHPQQNLEEQIVGGFVTEFEEGKGLEEITSKLKRRKDLPITELVKLANNYRNIADSSDYAGLREGPGTRLVARTAKLIEYGIPEMAAIEVAMINPLTYDKEQKTSLKDVAKKLFR